MEMVEGIILVCSLTLGGPTLNDDQIKLSCGSKDNQFQLVEVKDGEWHIKITEKSLEEVADKMRREFLLKQQR